jgi:hypothetical protein
MKTSMSSTDDENLQRLQKVTKMDEEIKSLRLLKDQVESERN